MNGWRRGRALPNGAASRTYGLEGRSPIQAAWSETTVMMPSPAIATFCIVKNPYRVVP